MAVGSVRFVHSTDLRGRSGNTEFFHLDSSMKGTGSAKDPIGVNIPINALNRAWFGGGGDFNPYWMIPFADTARGTNEDVTWGLWGVGANQSPSQTTGTDRQLNPGAPGPDYAHIGRVGGALGATTVVEIRKVRDA